MEVPEPRNQMEAKLQDYVVEAFTGKSPKLAKFCFENNSAMQVAPNLIIIFYKCNVVKGSRSRRSWLVGLNFNPLVLPEKYTTPNCLYTTASDEGLMETMFPCPIRNQIFRIKKL